MIYIMLNDPGRGARPGLFDAMQVCKSCRSKAGGRTDTGGVFYCNSCWKGWTNVDVELTLTASGGTEISGIGQFVTLLCAWIRTRGEQRVTAAQLGVFYAAHPSVDRSVLPATKKLEYLCGHAEARGRLKFQPDPKASGGGWLEIVQVAPAPAPAHGAEDAVAALFKYVESCGGEISAASGVADFYNWAMHDGDAFKEALRSLGFKKAEVFARHGLLLERHESGSDLIKLIDPGRGARPGLFDAVQVCESCRSKAGGRTDTDGVFYCNSCWNDWTKAAAEKAAAEKAAAEKAAAEKAEAEKAAVEKAAAEKAAAEKAAAEKAAAERVAAEKAAAEKAAATKKAADEKAAAERAAAEKAAAERIAAERAAAEKAAAEKAAATKKAADEKAAAEKAATEKAAAERVAAKKAVSMSMLRRAMTWIGLPEAQKAAAAKKAADEKAAAAKAPPPPPGLKLEGGSLPGQAANYIGTYLLDHRKLVNGRPAFQHTSDATLWIAFDGDRWIGCVSALGDVNMGHLYLQDSAAASPDVSAKTWQASAGGASAWVEAPQLKCTAWKPPLSAAEKAAAEEAAAEKAAAERAAAEKAAAAAAASTPAVAGSPKSPTAASTSRAPGQSQPGPAHLWMWEDGAVGSGAWQLFDTASEETFRNHEEAGVLHFRIEIRGQAYDVDLSRCTQQNVRTGFVRNLKRHALTDVDKDLPSLSQFPGSYGQAPLYWADIPTQGIGHAPYVLGEILSTPPLFTPKPMPIERHVALCDFVRSMMPPQLHSRLLTVSHIRSEARFNLYQAARDALISRIGRAQLNETWLWHGTSRNTLESIMANGFDRNMNERGQYGVGSYFSNQLEYSLREEYAKPDDEGSQWVLLVRVLVGQSCVGKLGMRQPDKKPGGGAVLFESMVNSLQKPSIFVLSTGSDNHAYPEFVLRLRSSRF
jgi:uncharacterized Zn ribbon protein